ncbi:hypothetical protein [Croceicoccus sp. Ery15]|uniref:hypothetical protein n=1 Tax=Croceicoccus sp. Ery15 TaxID=1703338 RepID=UPI001E3A7A39|nr:hypothetical protein [Croceicoccus sp. Ery15]
MSLPRKIHGSVKVPANMNLHALHGEEYEIELLVSYTVTAESPATHWEPGEAASVDIESIQARTDKVWHPADWLIDMLWEDGEIVGACLNDAEERHQDALEQRADAAREERMFRESGL